MTRQMRKPSRVRVVGYSFDGDIDLEVVEHLLARAQAAGVVTQYDSTKSASRGMDRVWFNGPPGAELRRLRDAIKGLVK